MGTTAIDQDLLKGFVDALRASKRATSTQEQRECRGARGKPLVTMNSSLRDSAALLLRPVTVTGATPVVHNLGGTAKALKAKSCNEIALGFGLFAFHDASTTTGGGY